MAISYPDLDWSQIIEELQAPFPKKALKQRDDDPEKYYVPYQLYEYRLEKALGSQWSKDIRLYDVTDKHVKMITRVTIGQYFRDGYGFAEIIRSVSNAVDLAYSESFRNAVDSFLMGWHDLGLYQSLKITSGPELGGAEIRCKKCSKIIAPKMIEEIRSYPRYNFDKVGACLNCVSPHLLK